MGRLKSFVAVTLDVFGVPHVIGDQLYLKAPYTTCAIRLPQASGPIVGLDVGRDSEYVTRAAPPGSDRHLPGFTGPPPWLGHELDPLGFPGWRVAWRGRGRQEVVSEIVLGPVKRVLELPLPPYFRIQFQFGTLVVSQRGFFGDQASLDQLTGIASSLAREIRGVCAAHAQPQPFEAELPRPSWAAKIEELPKDTFAGLHGQDLKQAELVARELGMVSEDPFAFHVSFPHLPVPGEAIGVFRGVLPETSLQGRLVCGMERPLRDPPKGWKRHLEQMPHGEFGCDAVLLPAPGAPDAHGDAGAPWGGRGRYALRDGVLVAWRPRSSPQPWAPELRALTADAVGFARGQGLLPPG